MKPEVSPNITKNTQISNFMKLCPLGAKLFHADRWPDMMKLTVTLCNFANAPKNWWEWNNTVIQNQNINHKANVKPHENSIDPPPWRCVLATCYISFQRARKNPLGHKWTNNNILPLPHPFFTFTSISSVASISDSSVPFPWRPGIILHHHWQSCVSIIHLHNTVPVCQVNSDSY